MTTTALSNDGTTQPQSNNDIEYYINGLLGDLSISPEKKYSALFSAMYKLCKENDWGDPFSYARSREILMANTLGHKVAGTYSGADGYDEFGEYEYKSTITNKINGAYNGISVQDTIEKQIDYINNEKIKKYKTHYYARFKEDKIVEMWSIPGEVVADILLPKVITQYNSKKSKPTKDPRIGVTVTNADIKKYGSKIAL